ncbi:PEGA domain-containing protein [Poriferisphaera sp. WC338]|uniref:PEGA domain-containing protein n=1 Tax=Poriferisphaera sp. WC338 TaxID=3425129 RepID=UPI003D8185AB
MKKHVRKTVAGLMVFGLLLGVGGCVKRKINISSAPEGALVYLNDQEVGRTPLDVGFTFYGTYDVRIEKQGYQPLWTTAKTDAPWWEFPGPDFFAEIMPGTKEVNIDWHFELTKTTEEHENPDTLLEHAEQMRDQTNNPTTKDKGEQP